MAEWSIVRLRKRDWQALSVWLFTVVLLLGAFGIYSYLYVERREQYFTEKKLRELRLVGDRLKLRVENIANNVLPNAVNAADGGISCQAKTADPLLNVFETDGSSLVTSRLANLEETCNFLAVAKKTQLVPNFKLEKTIEYRRTAGPNGKAATLSLPSRLSIRTEGDTPAFLFTYQSIRAGQDLLAPKWRGRIELPNLLGQGDLESFDQLVVTDRRGEVQFQVGATRIASTNVASLVQREGRSEKPVKSGEGGDASSLSMWSSAKDSTSVVPVTVAGEDYLLFLQPVRISLLGGESADQLTAGEALDWRVVGLIARERFKRESSTFSYTIIVVFLFVLLLLVFAEPFIKVSFLGSMDRLRKRDVLLLCVSCALITALITLFAADMFVYASLEEQIDSQLETLVRDINHGLNEDLSDLLLLLKNASEKEIPPPEKTSLVGLLDTPVVESVKPVESECPGTGDTGRKAADLDRYPSAEELKREFQGGAFFERIVWIDPCGTQRRKWTIYKTSTPLIQVAERPYFQNARNSRLWQKKVDDRNICFWLGPIESWNTGERLATLSVRGPATNKEDSLIDAGCESHIDQSSHWVISLDATLPSLRDVVLPPGYGFVVIDRGGAVLFHSDPARHLRENFFEESDQEPALRAAVFGGATEFINARYLGTDYRLLSSAFEAPPWTLIVFYDKHFLRTANVEILWSALILFLIFLALQVPALVLLWFQDARWLWPNPSSRDAYPPYLLGVFGQLVVLSVAILFFSPVSAAYAAFLVPSVGFVATYFYFGANKSTGKPRIGLWDGVLSIGPLSIAAVALLYCCWVEYKTLELLVISFGTALCAFLVFSPRIRRWSRAMKGLASARTCYMLKVALLLILMGFLPVVGVFRVAYENEIILLLKHGQYRLEESLDLRKARLKEQAIKISGQAGEDYFNKQMEGAMSRGVYVDFFFRCTPFNSVAETSVPYRSPLGGAIKALRLHTLFDPVAVEGQGLLHGISADHSPSWLGGHPSCLLLTANSANTPNANARLVRAVQVPDWRRPASLAWFGVLMLFLVGLVKGVAAIAEFIARRIFLIDLVVPGDAERAPDLSAFAAGWNSCIHEEKIALYDFAGDGFLNSKNRSVPSLLKRGLLTLWPLRLANNDFRDVIQREGAKDESLTSENQEEVSVWRMVKWPLLVALLGMAVFLFFNQRKVFEGGVGFLGAMAAAVTAFFNLFDQVRGGKR